MNLDLSPRAKKMGVIILVLILLGAPLRWSLNKLDNFKSSAAISNLDSLNLENNVSKANNSNKSGDISNKVDLARLRIPKDSSLPTLIPEINKAVINSGMLLAAGSPTKATTGAPGSQITAKSGSSTSYTISISVKGPTANIYKLLNNLEQMERVISIDSFVVQQGDGKGNSNVNLVIKFYSLGGI